MIKTNKLVFEYEKHDDDGHVIGVSRAIDELDIDIKPGQFVAILGHNGSGKSTLAKHMNSILVPTAGTMWVDGKDTRQEENLWDVRQSAGMVFQNPDNQIIGCMVEEDVGFGPENLGVPTEEIWQRVEESLRAVGMIEYREHSPNKLSGGQKQRVAIAGVMAMRPKCIVLDEPTAMLDPKGRREVMETIRKLNKYKDITVVLITHHMDEAAQAQRVVVLHQGEVALDGDPREVFAHVEKLHEIRLAAPETVELCWELNKEGFNLPLTRLNAEECAQTLYEELKV